MIIYEMQRMKVSLCWFCHSNPVKVTNVNISNISYHRPNGMEVGLMDLRWCDQKGYIG